MVDQECKSYTKNKTMVMACKCCSKFCCKLEDVKEMFHDLHKEYWALPQPNNISASEQASVEGGMLAKFLEKYCTFLSKHKPMYEFLVPKGNVVISLCLPTTVRIFGLPKKHFR